MSDLTGNTAAPATTAVLTGATSGIGEHVTRHLAGTIDTLIVHGPKPDGR
jgi:NADP-dependent 3-hydroxy acid dehydrogenase YdfG